MRAALFGLLLASCATVVGDCERRVETKVETVCRPGGGSVVIVPRSP